MLQISGQFPWVRWAEYPEPEEMAGMDPVDLPPSTDPRLAIRLKELDLELSKQRYQSQLLQHARTVEIESHRANQAQGVGARAQK